MVGGKAGAAGAAMVDATDRATLVEGNMVYDERHVEVYEVQYFLLYYYVFFSLLNKVIEYLRRVSSYNS
jgi:hypothetical protein